MEFQEVVRRRRMIRHYDPDRPIATEVVDRILENALRGPSAGFSQGFGFLVLDTREDLERFWTAAPPSERLADMVHAPLLIGIHSNKDVYLDRYAQSDKNMPRSDSWWPVPYWDIDAGMAALLILQTAVDAGLGACFFGLLHDQIKTYRELFGVPESMMPIGFVSIGYAAEPTTDPHGFRRATRDRRKPTADMIRRGHWTQPDA